MEVLRIGAEVAAIVSAFTGLVTLWQMRRR